MITVHQTAEKTQASAKILIVDDSATIRATLSRAVGSEFEALEADNGQEALELLEKDASIDLVVTDLAMPELDGYGLIRCIRSSSDNKLSNMPVIVVTGANDTEARERAFVEGANDFIAKTSDHVEFLARVRAHQKLAKTLQELERSRLHLHEQANTDPLTHLANRRSFFRMAQELMQQMRSRANPFSVVMLDIDHFKEINDTYGHKAGDYVLVQLAEVLNDAIREGDILARIGGEEFVVASPMTNRLAAIVLSERLRKSVEQSEFVFEGSKIPVTISLGAAAMSAEPDDDLDKLMAVADGRLYLAKQRGRNRICASDKLGKGDNDAEFCPQLDEALILVRHGNAQRIKPYIKSLARQLIPLLEVINAEVAGGPIDIGCLLEGIEALEHEEQHPEPED